MAQEIIARIRRREKKRAYCLTILDLWAQVQTQGINIERVKSFGLDTRVLTPQQKIERCRRPGCDPFIETLASGTKRPRVYNYVRHHDGGITRLGPMLAAVYEEES